MVRERTMRLALHTDFALRTLLYVATMPGRATVGEIADFYKISVNHLGKVVHQLGRLGYVRNVRGPRGGIELARNPADVTVGAVVRDFEDRNVDLLECIDTAGVCVIQPGCGLRAVLAEAGRRQMDYLDGVTLASLLPKSGDLVTLMSP
jgi:Rrf2 family nitric oxide-sensitive transcriptional repressor